MNRMQLFVLGMSIVCVTVLINREIERRKQKDGRDALSVGFLTSIANTLSASAGAILVSSLIPPRIHHAIESARNVAVSK
jgi:hypothetical protein